MKINRKEETAKRRKEVFFAYYVEDMSVQMISYLTGYSLNTIEKNIKNIRKNLQDYINDLAEY